MFACVGLFLWVCMCGFACGFACGFVCVGLHVWVCMCGFAYVCVGLGMCVWVCVCLSRRQEGGKGGKEWFWMVVIAVGELYGGEFVSESLFGVDGGHATDHNGLTGLFSPERHASGEY